MSIVQAFLGVAVFIGVAYGLSENRKAVSWKLVLGALAMQFLLALILLNLPFAAKIFLYLNNIVLAVDTATKAGSGFMFGYLGGAPTPFDVTQPQNGLVIAFMILPIVIVMSAISAVLFYYGVIQWIVRGFAWLMNRFMDVGGAMGLGVAASVFLGIIEAPLLVKPYIKTMHRSELFTLITAGMATVAGTVMVLYASILKDTMPDAAAQILIASLISAPAAVLFGQVMIPRAWSKTSPGETVDLKSDATSVFDAAVRGTIDGLHMTLQIGAIIIVLFAFVSLINQALGLIPSGNTPISLQWMAGYLFAPFCWLMGIPSGEIVTAGGLMATKTLLNEFVAYQALAGMSTEALSAGSQKIMIYAMCGFANFGSLGILVGGLGAMAPERREELTKLCLKAMISGTLATMMTGAIVGIFS